MSQAILDFCPLFFGPELHTNLIIFLCISYLIASIPFGLVFSKICGGKDLTMHGSGNIGATNAFRVGGKKVGILTFICDFLKGLLPIVIAPHILDILAPQIEMFYVIIGAVCVLGHVYSFWLKGKGGKGVATALGTILAINPTLFMFAALIWGITFFISRISAIAALATFIILPFLNLMNNESSVWFMDYLIFLSGLIILTHTSNIIKLWHTRKSADRNRF
jgi:glycerol-3-phosphate acyltransferase PlsY